jgi:hypothetical protein
MPIPELFRYFPNLAASDAEKKSPDVPDYNCIAWAAGEVNKRWWPRASGCYWPPGIRADSTLEAFIEAFNTLGYVSCVGGDLELGYEKVAIYTFNNQVKHMARQLSNGRWSSKLGEYENIEHELDDLTSNHSDGYGEVTAFMRRLNQEC